MEINLTNILSILAVLTVAFGIGRWTGAMETMRKELTGLDTRFMLAVRVLEEKSLKIMETEIKRNDEITGLIANNTKDLAVDQKHIIQRLAVVETVCDICSKNHLQ